MIELNKIYNEDCLEGMKRIPDKSVDMILCDLPYGTTACKWDTIIPFEPLWEQYERVIKDSGAIVLTGAQPFTSVLVMSNLKLFRQTLVWKKSRPTNMMNAKKMFMKYHEDVVVFYKKLPTYNPEMEVVDVYTKTQKLQDRSKGIFGKTGEKADYVHNNGGLKYPNSVLSIASENKRIHPTQKPVALFEYLIKTYTNEGETILDNCMGSGTTAIACMNTNRNFIGFELDETYFNLANERIVNHK